MEESKLKLTAVVLAKNEAERIADCLNTLGFAGQLVVIDNGSADDTVKIAEKLGADVYRYKVNDFSKLRNFALTKSRGDWILYIDADERVTPKLQTEILNLIKVFTPQSQPHGYFIKRKNYYLGHEWPYQDKLERLFRRESLAGWYGKVHETPKVKGPIGTLTEPLLHYTHRTLEEMVEKTDAWSTVEAELRLKVNHPPVVWWRLLRVMITGFWISFISQEGWKAGTTGLVESIYQSFSMFITYAKLWELQNISQKSKVKSQN